MSATVTPISKDKRQVEGIVTVNGKAHDINGLAELRADLLSNLQLEMSAKDGGYGSPKVTLEYKLEPRNSGYDLSSTVRYGPHFATVKGRSAVRHKYDWDLDLQVRSTIKTRR